MAFMAAVLPFSIALSAPAHLLSARLLSGSRQTVDLPSQDKMEDDKCENADKGHWRERIDQKGRCRYNPNQPEHNAHPAQALAKGRGPEHGHPESNETYRH